MEKTHNFAVEVVTCKMMKHKILSTLVVTATILLGVVLILRHRTVFAVIATTINLSGGQHGSVTCAGGALRNIALDQTGLRYQLYCEGALAPPSASPNDIIPQDGAVPASDQIINYADLPTSIQAIAQVRHPVPPALIIETRYQEYSDGAQVYSVEYLQDGNRWLVGITMAGTVFRDEQVILP